MVMKNDTPTVENAVIYARFSSHAQNEQSIEGQMRVCSEYAAREGITIVGEYIDRAISGKTDDRPSFQKMISDSRKKAFQFIIVYKLDRFARNRYDSAIYKHKLKQNGVRLLSAMENIGDNPESIILEAVLEASAEYYSIDLAQKIRRGYRESAEKGNFIGGYAPYGYKKEGKKLAIDERTAPIVKWALEAYADGTPKKEIIAELNRRGLKNRNGKPFAASGLQNVFKNEKYYGVLDQYGVRIEDGCPALIDKETFDRIQERLDVNAHHGAKNKAEDEYLLSGKVFCGLCGSPMQGVSGTGHKGVTYNYYQCSKRRRHECPKKHEKKGFLEWYVVEQTRDYVLTPERMDRIAKGVIAEYQKEFSGDAIKKLDSDINVLYHKIKKLTDIIIDLPKESRQTFIDELNVYAAEKADLEIDLQKLKIAAEIQYSESDIKAWLKGFTRGDLLDTDFQKRIIDVFVNSVYVFDDKIIIYYNIRGGQQVSYLEMTEDIEDLMSETPENSMIDEVCISNAHLHLSIWNTNPQFIFTSGMFGLVCFRN